MNFVKKLINLKCSKFRNFCLNSAVKFEQKNIKVDLKDSDAALRPFSKDVLLSRFDLTLLEFPEVDNNDGVEMTNNVSKEIEKLMEVKGSVVRRELLTKLSATGIMGVSIPGAVIGGKYTWIMVARMIEALSKDVSFTLTNYLPQMFVCQSVIHGGDDNQKEKYMRSLVNGEIKGCVALTEQVSDFINTESITAKVSVVEADGSWILNGHKTSVFNYKMSDVVVVWALTPSGEVASFILDSKSKGISQIEGESNTLHSDLSFVNVPVLQENMLSSTRGIQFPRYICSVNNVSVSAMCSSLIKSLVRQVNDFVCSRHIFGKPLSQFQRVQAKIVDLTLEAYCTESVTYLLAGTLDKNCGGDFLIESVSAKVYSLESLRRSLDICMNIVGINCLNNPSFKVSFDESNILLRNQAAPTLSRLDSTKESIDYVVEMMKTKKFNLMEKIAETFGNYKIKGYLEDNIITNSFKYNLHPRLGHLADSVYEEYYSLTKILQSLSKSEEILKDDFCVEKLSGVLVDSFVMMAVMGRASRSTCIGLRNHDHEVRLAEIICGRICKRIKNEVSILKKYPENVNEWNKAASSIKVDVPNFHRMSPATSNI